MFNTPYCNVNWQIFKDNTTKELMVNFCPVVQRR